LSGKHLGLGGQLDGAELVHHELRAKPAGLLDMAADRGVAEEVLIGGWKRQ
jgi:hypothetical protein